MITKELFGVLPDGKDVYLYTLQNKNGSNVKIMSLGATIVSINVPDKNSVFADVVCGYDNVKAYLENGGYQGATIGRFGNRIENSRFVIDGTEYKLFNNEGKNHLHGGKIGFDKKIWDAEYWEIGDTSYIEFSILSKDGEEGYPGNLKVKVLFSFNDSNELVINYKATTDKKTVLNLTNHSYFNLGGYDSGSIINHTLQVDADEITDIRKDLIPTGKKISVDSTPFDFRKEKAIGKDIEENNRILKYGQGYDHNYILNSDGTVKHIATLKDPVSGRIMKVFTNQPCVQIYTANCIDEEGSTPFKNGIAQKKRCAVCLETQHAPNSPNIESFDSCVLNVGELYDYTTVFKFEN